MEFEIDDWDETGECKKFCISVSPDKAGQRLDHFLVTYLVDYSRSQISAFIKKGDIAVNGDKGKASKKLKAGDQVNGSLHLPGEIDIVPQPLDFPVLFEDDYLLLISKPPNLVVHPGSGNPDNTLVNGLVHYCSTIQSVGDPVRPGIIHRLDKDTTGIMVVAKTDTVHRKMVEMFKERKVIKKYQAIVKGVPDDFEGRIVAPIGRHPVNRKKMAVNEKDGKFAATNWFLLQNFDEFSHLELLIETGRTHQIRVHMASIGHPVAGDSVYGQKKLDQTFPRQMLHSSELRFIHPETGRKIVGKAPLWPDMEKAIETLKGES